MNKLSQPKNLQDILKWEMDDLFSREKVTVLSGQNLSMGAVVGKITKGVCPITGTAGDGNTGGGACTGVTAGVKAKVGTYTLKCIVVQAGSGIFTVEDPDGYGLPDAKAEVAYTNDQLNFTINDGSPDYVVGDIFTIRIAAGSGKVKAVASAGLIGDYDAHGILTAAVNATGGDTEGVAIVRNARVVSANLVWPAESPLETTKWLVQLAAEGILEVSEV